MVDEYPQQRYVMGQFSISAHSIGFQEIQVCVQVTKITIEVLASANWLNLDELSNPSKFPSVSS